MKTFPAVALVAGILVTACSREHGGGPFHPANPVQALIEQARANATQSFTVSASAGGAVFGAKGTIITFQPNAFFNDAGDPVSGPVTIELLEAPGVGDMVRFNLRTVALQGGIKRQLQSGGEVRVTAEAGGEQLTVAANLATIHVPAASPDPEMRRYVGVEDDAGNVLWEDDGELALDSGVAVPDSGGGWGWIPGDYYVSPWPPYDFFNCDRPFPPGGDSTDVIITVPAEFAGWNTYVFIVLPDVNCMVYQEAWNGNSVGAGFPLRIGLSGTIVAFSQTASGLYSAFVPITIEDDHHQTITLEPTTEAEYQAGLDAL